MLTDQPTGLGRLERAATIGVAFLAAGSFALSYDALHQLAVANHVPRPLAWMWPLIVDGFIIVASLAVLHAILTRRAPTYPWLLVIAFSTTSVTFNIVHAPPTLVARSVAAIPPLTLVLSFELLMRQLSERLRQTVRNVELSGPCVNTRAATVEPVETAEVERFEHASRVTSPLDATRELVRQHTEAGARLTGKQLGDLLGVSDGYARRLLRQAADHTSQ